MARERGRGQIIPWADGSFHLRWYSHVEDGRRKYAGKRVVGTRQDAEAELARVLAERAAERAGGGDASPQLKGETLSLSELVDRWLLSLEVGGTGARTREGYVHELAGLLRAMGALPAGKITRTMIERHLMELEREGRSRRTRAGLVVLLRSVFEYALAEALIWRSPVEHLKLARASRGTRRPQVLTPEQLRAFLQAAESDRHLAYWVLAVGTGARPGELAGLEWRHVDLERAEIRIEQALTIEGGKLVIGPTKTGKERTVPVAGTVVAALRAHRAQQAKGALRSGLRGWKGHDLVFMGREAQPLNVNSMNSKTFKRIAKVAGLPEGLRAYCLRHSHASALLDAGEPPQRVAERLGHGVETLLRVYSHALAGREIQTAATAARVLFGE